MVIFLARNANHTTDLRTLQGYIQFPILKQFAIKLCNFIHFKMLFPAMVMVSFFLSRSKFRL
jgi:hypothetical protein